MTLDKAIKYAEKIAEENEKQFGGCPMKYDGAYANNSKTARVCAEEHRQLAGWLKELKALKEQQPCDDAISRQAVKDMLMREWTRYIPMDLDVNLSFVLAKVDELPLVKPQHTEAEIQKMQELEQSEIQKAYELGKAEMQPCEDCISREAVIDMTGLSEWFDSSDSYNEFVIALSNLPPVTSQPKTGHWIVNKKVDTAYDISGYKSWAISYACEHCGFIHQAIENHGVYSYCPNCGARMVEPQESEVQDAK